jgi:hypothetical protein
LECSGLCGVDRCSPKNDPPRIGTKLEAEAGEIVKFVQVENT